MSSTRVNKGGVINNKDRLIRYDLNIYYEYVKKNNATYR